MKPIPVPRNKRQRSTKTKMKTQETKLDLLEAAKKPRRPKARTIPPIAKRAVMI